MTNSLPLLSLAAANPTGRSNPPAITSQVNRSAAGSLSTFAGVGVETGSRCGVSAGGRAVLLSLVDVGGMGVTVRDGVSVSEGVALRVFTGELVGDVADAVHRERERRIRKLGGQ